MVAERERACNEGVLDLGSEPRVYAEAILNICKLYVESPLVCVSGVAGANLRRRIEAIMASRIGQRLNRAKKLLLASAGVAALAGPVVIGVVIGVGNAPAVRAQSPAAAQPMAKTAPAAPVPAPTVQATTPQQGAIGRTTEKPLAFDAASIKPSNSAMAGDRGGPGGGGGRLQFSPGRVLGRNVTAKRIILEAYHLLKDYQLLGGPGWIDSARFDLEAKSDTPASENQLRQMLQTLLVERFKLVVHRETKEMPIYALIVGKNGSKLHELKEGEPTPTSTKELISLGVLPPRGKEDTFAHVMFDRGKMQDFADELSRNPSIDRPVLDKTGLRGTYLFALWWDADENFMTVVQEQLGLKFESQKAPVDIFVIDKIEKPDKN